MEETENIFFAESGDIDSSIPKDKLKIGEIFQHNDGTTTLNCIHCSQEFHFFTEFTLHIQEHYLRNEILPQTGNIKCEDETDFIDNNSMPIAEISVKCEKLIDLKPDDINDSYYSDNDNFDTSFNNSNSDIESAVNGSDENSLFQRIVSGQIKEREYKAIADKFQCMICSADIQKWDHFKEHCRRHREKQLYIQVLCPLCKKAFSNVHYARKHVDRFHRKKISANEIRSAQAELGNTSISLEPKDAVIILSQKKSTENKIDEPKNESEEKKFITDSVNETLFPNDDFFEDEPILNKHYEKIGRKFKCLTCPRIASKYSQFLQHYRTHLGVKNFHCSICSKAFLSAQYVQKHMRRFHKRKISSRAIVESQKGSFITKDVENLTESLTTEFNSDIDTKPIRCLFCTSRFALLCYAHKHMRYMHGKYLSFEEILVAQKNPDLTLEDFSDNKRQKSNESKSLDPSTFPFECFECHRPLKTLKSLKNHMQLHSDKTYGCPMCPQTFRVTNYVRDHLVFKHGLHRNEIVVDMIKQTINVHPRPKQISEFECFLCKNRFQCENKLRNHMKTHTMVSVLCSICNAVYKSKDTLRHHMEIHNADPEQPVKCDDCNKIFPTRRYMLNHKRKVHSLFKKSKTKKEYNHKCDDCGKMFTHLHTLNQHMQVHSKDVNDLKCEICGWEFNERGNLKQHMETHTNNKTVCNVCDKVLSVRYLQEHMKIHMGSKDVQCSVCGKQFVNGERLKRHMIRHGGELKFKCEKCPKAYTRQDKLLYHLRHSHPEMLTLICGTCNTGFLSLRALRRHENDHYREQHGILGVKPTTQT